LRKLLQLLGAHGLHPLTLIRVELETEQLYHRLNRNAKPFRLAFLEPFGPTLSARRAHVDAVRGPIEVTVQRCLA
jgi:hypothetical protein